FDMVSISFAAPFLIKDWGVAPDMIGIVFSVVAVGMVLGGVFLAPIGDKIGRRPTLLGAMALMGVLMVATSLANSITALVVIRFFTGLMLGVLISNLNVIVSEFSNRRSASVMIGLLHIGYAIGAVLCSGLAALLIESHGWQSIFLVGAALNFVMVAVGFFVLPESLDFLISRRPAKALERINSFLIRTGREALEVLPEVPATVAKPKVGMSGLVAAGLAGSAVLLMIAGFAHYFTSQFQSNWTPKILTDVGLSTTMALSSGMVLGFGAAGGNLLMGFLSSRFDARYVTVVFFGLCALSLLTFGFGAAHPVLLLTAAGAISLFIQGSYTGIVINATRTFPAEMRSTGMGIVVGLGRTGGVLGTYLAGVFMTWGWDRSAFYPVFAGVCTVGMIAIILLRSTHSKAAPAAKPATAS
ncbi:MAG: MFS transporter, partial [Devosia sp.]